MWSRWYDRRSLRRWLWQAVLPMLLGGMVLLPAGWGYSVQTHEQLVDLAWKPAIEPLLLERFPKLTRAELEEAHAYAYGGCAIQDLGYYPFGKAFFSDLTHYVRSGDFVQSLLRDARTADELAFAVGAMSHFVGDTTGHSLAVNPSVAKEFPKLEARYGPSVPYDVSPHAHVRTEFAFDINEISKHRFAPSAYLRHVGLKVADDLLERAFFETYGLHLADVLGGKRERPALTGYRFSVRSFLPRIAYAETVLHRRQMPADVQDADFVALERALKQSEFENGWEPFRKKAGVGTYTLAGLFVVLPKIGPLAELAIKVPDAATEQAYVKSVNASTVRMRKVIADVEQRAGPAIKVDLVNRDLDTGLTVKPGGYRLTDETYAKLVQVLSRRPKAKLPSGLKDDIERYYADPEAPISTRKNAGKWAELQFELEQVRQMETIAEP